MRLQSYALPLPILLTRLVDGCLQLGGNLIILFIFNRREHKAACAARMEHHLFASFRHTQILGLVGPEISCTYYYHNLHIVLVITVQR